MRFFSLSCIALLCFSPIAHAAFIVDSPTDLGGANVLMGTVPNVSNGSVIYYTITSTDVTNTELFFQFEFQEPDASLDLGLGFYEDSSPDGAPAGNTLFWDYDILPGNSTIDGPETLSAVTNQRSFEWRISGIDSSVLGHEISVEIVIANASAASERARFSQVSAVPEPSSLLFLGLAGLAVHGRKHGPKLKGWISKLLS